jgi:hypothetical protein
MPNNYARGKIYKIVCRKTGLQYFGSTTEPTLARRLVFHVGSFKHWKKTTYKYMTSYEVLKENDYYIELIELVCCSSNDELKVRERFHIQNNECVNKYIPLRTTKEHYEDNKEHFVEYQKIYREEHKEELKEYFKNNYKEHKEERLEKAKEYRQVNKDKIKEKEKKEYICNCGSIIQITEKARHKKSKKHILFISSV